MPDSYRTPRGLVQYHGTFAGVALNTENIHWTNRCQWGSARRSTPRSKRFLNRPIEGDWPNLWIDATYVKFVPFLFSVFGLRFCSRKKVETSTDVPAAAIIVAYDAPAAPIRASC